MKSRLSNELNQNRRVSRIIQNGDEYELYRKMMHLCQQFPSDRIEQLIIQVAYFITFFSDLQTEYGSSFNFSFIHQTSFPDKLYLLIMSDNVHRGFRKGLIELLTAILHAPFSPERLSFIVTENFLLRLFEFMQSDDLGGKLTASTIFACRLICSGVPDSLHLFEAIGILEFVSTVGIHSQNLDIFNYSLDFLMTVIKLAPQSFLENSSPLLLQLLFQTNDTRSLTYILSNVSELACTCPQFRQFLVHNGVCNRCIELIERMKKVEGSFQFYGDHAMKILACISEQGDDNEIRALLAAGVFETYFQNHYSFLDLSKYKNNALDDDDSFEHIARLLIGFLSRGIPEVNQIIEQLELIPQLCNIIIQGTISKRITAISIFVNGMSAGYQLMSDYFSHPQILEQIIKTLPSMPFSMTKTISDILYDLLQQIPDVITLFIDNDLVKILESLIEGNDNSEELQQLLNLISEVVEKAQNDSKDQ